MEKVFLGIPSSDLKVHPDIIASCLKASKAGRLSGFRTHSYSCLPRNFNELLCAALNAREDGITHFCMLHSDVVPHGESWLDVLVEEMNKCQADILSVVIPIKTHQGVTSTALDIPVDGSVHYWRPRRLTMTEIYQNYPETFTDDKLLINTGLMMIDIRGAWAEKVWFEFEDIIYKDGKKFVAQNVPEDWNFSRRAKQQGAKIFATRKVGVTHYGHTGYGNISIWGSQKTDAVAR